MTKLNGRFAIVDDFDKQCFRIHIRFQTAEDAAKDFPVVRDFAVEIPWEKLEPIKESFEYVFHDHKGDKV